MMSAILAAMLCSQAPCTGPNCPRPVATVAQASPDTEVVQRIWVTNENRYGLGVIRNGRFLAAQPAPDATPEPGALAGDSLNYGILAEEMRSPQNFGYSTNDDSFNPSHLSKGPAVPVPSPSPPGLEPSPVGLLCLIAGAFIFVLVIIILQIKGRSR